MFADDRNMRRRWDENLGLSVGFKVGQSANGGLGLEFEVCQTINAQMSALEPTVCQPVLRPFRTVETE